MGYVRIDTQQGLLNATEVAGMLGIPLDTLDRWRKLDVGPPAVRVIGEFMWLRPTLAAWVADGGALEYGIDLAPRPDVRDHLKQPLAV